MSERPAIVAWTAADVASLPEEARATERARARVSAHPDVDDRLHEMVIAVERGSYVRPHKHDGKSESFHVIDGEGRVVLFDDDGDVTDVIELGPYSSGRVFFYRLNEPIFHTVLVDSQTLLIHETTNGPFRQGDATQAPWAPADEDLAGREAFVGRLRERLDTGR